MRVTGSVPPRPGDALPSRALHELTAVQLAVSYRDRSLSPVEVARALLDRIAEVDPALNAFCFLDPETSLSAAARAETRFRDGAPLGPLDGVPVAVKDLLLTQGWPTLRGSVATPRNAAWTEDAPSVARLRRQGAVLIGKTTTPEHGWKGVTDSPLTGVTRNPHDPAMTAGGSSGGSAAAVAAGMAPLALGTDGGGSIRIPSAFCGIVGLKPTVGVVPVWPPSPFGVLSHVGPHARTVEDTALLLAAISGPSPLDLFSAAAYGRGGGPETGSSGGPPRDRLRVAYSRALDGTVTVADDVAARVEAGVDELERSGHRVTAIGPDELALDDALAVFETLWYAGAARVVDLVPSDARAGLDPGLLEIAEAGRGYPVAAYVAAMQRRAELAAEVDRLLGDFDVLVLPTLPLDGFEAGQEVPTGWADRRWTSWTPFTYPFNITGHPALSVPCGFSRRGLPIGLQVVGRRYEESTVVAVGEAVELGLARQEG